jgi:hypothetical protein
MQLTERTTTIHHSDFKMLPESNLTDPVDWSKAFNTSILSTVLDSKGQDADIEVILSSPEYEAILLAAKSLSVGLDISPEEATERLIQTFRNIDSSWKNILLKKGAQSLLGL